MTTPTLNMVHVDRPLTNISIAYVQNANQFVHGRVFPMVPVSKQSDLYFTFNQGDFMRNDFRPRAPGTESAGSGFGMSTEQYNCRIWALHKDIDDQIRANSDDPIDMDRATTEFLTQQSLIQRESTFAAKYLATGVWGYQRQGVSGTPGAGQVLKWSDDGSDPVAQVKAAMSAIHAATGLRPNTLTLAQDARDALDTNPAVIDRLKYGQTAPGAAVVTDADLARVFGVERVLVSGAVINSAAEGATPAIDFVTKGKALLTYSAPAPALMMPSAGYTFTWRGLLGNAEGALIKKFRMEHLNSDRIEQWLAYDQKVVGASLGALFYDLV